MNSSCCEPSFSMTSFEIFYFLVLFSSLDAFFISLIFFLLFSYSSSHESSELSESDSLIPLGIYYGFGSSGFLNSNRVLSSGLSGISIIFFFIGDFFLVGDSSYLFLVLKNWVVIDFLNLSSLEYSRIFLISLSSFI